MSWRRENPTPGWKGRIRADAVQNPRPPAAPATLHLTLPEYFAAAATIGLLSASDEEPNQAWVASWSLDYGYEIARQAEERRRRERDSSQRPESQ